MTGGIFCIENWSSRMDSKESVAALLTFLEDHGAARTIHQRVSTPAELGHYLARFSVLESYGVCHLAMHGSKGRVYVGAVKDH